MGLTWLLATLAMIGLLAPQEGGGVLDGALAVAWAIATLIILMLPRGRRAVREALSRHWLGAGLFLTFFGVLAAQSMFAPDPALARLQAERSLILLAAVGLAGLAVAAAALRQGPSDALHATLAAAAAAGVAILLLATLSDRPLQAGLGLAALCVAAAFGVVEAMRRADRAGTYGVGASPLMRRLFVPAAAFLSCAVGLAALRDVAGVLAAIAGIAVFGGIYAVRARQTQRRQVLCAIAAMVALVGALSLAILAMDWPQQQDLWEAAAAAMAVWREVPLNGIGVSGLTVFGEEARGAPAGAKMLAETGMIGLVAGALALLATALALAATPDRDRRPSRGGALFSGLAATAVMSACLSPAVTEPAQLFVLAGLLGLAGAYGERKAGSVTVPAGSQAANPQVLAKQSPAAASGRPAGVGIQRL
jgi:hypothetical protein